MSVEVEQWLPVVGYEGLYSVSSKGRVYSHYKRGSNGKIMAQRAHETGHLSVGLSKGDVKKQAYVHALVLAMFVGPRPIGLEVRHLDGNPTNNSVANLAYGTRSENLYDKVRHGTDHNVRKTHCPYGHPYTPENTKPNHGGRACRECGRRNDRERKRRLRARARNPVDVPTDVAG